MATETWSSKVRHDSDATFREWGVELQTKLLAAGLVADETNINWVTVVRAGANAEAGYEVYHLGDALFATAPVYIRIGYGTGGGTTSPRIQVTVGTSTNGSGVLGGTALTTIRSIHTPGAQITDTARDSFLCVNEGFVGLNWKQAAAGTEALFVFNRTCDVQGTPTDTGGMVVWGSGSANALTATQALRFAATAAAFTAQTIVANTALGFHPQVQASTLVGSDVQVFLGWTITPQVAPLFGVCGAVNTEILAGVTFPTVLVGTTPRTYIALTTVAGPFGPGPLATPEQPKFAMLATSAA